MYKIPELVEFNDLLAVPYVDGGRDVTIGLDCWGLAVEVCKRYGVALPDYRITAKEYAKIDREQYKAPWVRVEDPNVCCPPLIVVIRLHPVYFNHIGVWVDGGKIIHTTEDAGVVIERMNPILSRKIGGYYKICSE